MRLSCPHHGEMKEHEHDHDHEDESSGSELSTNKAVETDIINVPAVNFRSRVAFPPGVDDNGPVSKSNKDRRSLLYWQTGSNANLIFDADKRKPFYPCYHRNS